MFIFYSMPDKSGLVHVLLFSAIERRHKRGDITKGKCLVMQNKLGN